MSACGTSFTDDDGDDEQQQQDRRVTGRGRCARADLVDNIVKHHAAVKSDSELLERPATIIVGEFHPPEYVTEIELRCTFHSTQTRSFRRHVLPSQSLGLGLKKLIPT